MNETKWYMKEGSPEWIAYMKKNRPEELVKKEPPLKIEEAPLSEALPETLRMREERKVSIGGEEGPSRKIFHNRARKEGTAIENLRQMLDIPNWLVLVHLFPKALNPELHESIQMALFEMEQGYKFPSAISYVAGMGTSRGGHIRSLHVSGDGSIAMKTIDYWTEKFGDVEELPGGRRLSPKFHGMMDKMKKILRRRLWNA